jgi:prepilin-type N-terminal cleavage/methylation domain-containing protein
VSPLLKRRSLASFTLIELLVVVAVILILMGISLKITSAINRKTADARTIYVLEQTKNALEGYFLVMGSYPPVTNVLSSRAPNTDKWSWVPNNMNEKTGLVYYLSWVDHPRKASWQGYVKDVSPSVISWGSLEPHSSGMPGGGSQAWSNKQCTISDGYGSELIYRPDTNDYGSYRLWSCGPDRGTVIDGAGNPATTNDDIDGIGDM